MSHVIPEFCYESLYDHRHRAVGLSPRNPSRYHFIQKGVRSKIICDKCECLINDRYEKPFKAYWYDGNALSKFKSGARAHWLTDVDYSSFKLFHLSVLFRASASDHPNFREVALGPHEDHLRAMLLQNDPREDWRYPIVCCVIDRPGGGVWDDLIGVARRVKLEEHWGYYFAFAGAQWTYLVASHPSAAIKGLHLTKDGRLPMAKLPFKEIEQPEWRR